MILLGPQTLSHIGREELWNSSGEHRKGEIDREREKRQIGR